MPYEFTEKGKALLADVVSFMDDHIYPNEAEYREQPKRSATTATRRCSTS